MGACVFPSMGQQVVSYRTQTSNTDAKLPLSNFAPEQTSRGVRTVA